MNSRGVQRLLAVVLLMWCGGLTHGEEALHFEQRTARLSPTSEEMVVTAIFPFTNRTNRTVVITKASAGCGCITVQPSITTIPPGATGTVHVGMELGILAGIQIKTILLETDHPDEPRLALNLEVTIPSTPIITGNPILRWRQDHVEAPLYFGIALPSRFPFEFDRVTTTDPRIKADLVPPLEHRRYSVKVTVVDGSSPFSARVNIHMVGSAKIFPIPVQVVGMQPQQEVPTKQEAKTKQETQP